MRIYLHQTHHRIADFSAIFSMIKDELDRVSDEGIHVFPELFLTGYPLQDLCLNRTFITSYFDHLNKIQTLLQSYQENKNVLFLVGGLRYDLTADGLPEMIQNVVYKLIPGRKMSVATTKILLPDYDIFDEKKYFTPASSPEIIEWNNLSIALLICEDMWPSISHPSDPVQQLASMRKKIDLVINLSASPYDLHKMDKRIERSKEISHLLKAPFVYVNRVGYEDEIIFDGQSFITCGDDVLHQCQIFNEDKIYLDLPHYFNSRSKNKKTTLSTTWESLFAADIVHSKTLPRLRPLSDNDCDQITQAIGFAIQEYSKTCGFHKFLVALSGGIDSSLVLTLLKLSLKKNQSLEAIYMPSQYSQVISHDLSLELCQNLNIPLRILPITALHKSCDELFASALSEPLKNLADENIQSRMRGMLLMARANQTDAVVINTSNKSELAVGYSTIYGDSIGAISPLGDLYKSEVFMLAKYLNRKYSYIIPEGIISRPPTAELRSNQKDTDSLPPYDILDAILEQVLSYRMTPDEIISQGFSKEQVYHVLKLYYLSEYKRKQFCPIIKIKPKSFGFGYRIPICKSNEFYHS